jgi:hypothetical protein
VYNPKAPKKIFGGVNAETDQEAFEMTGRFLASLVTVLMVIMLALLATQSLAGQAATSRSPSAANATKRTPPRTPWGHPDLQGTWDNHSITPLERPERFAGREFLTREEAIALEKEAAQRNAEIDSRERAGTTGDVGTAYNEFWWDRPTNVVETLRTSLIVDPPDGKVPPLVPGARTRQGESELAYRPLRATGNFEGGRGADTWTDRSLWERCITQGLPRISSGAYNSNIEIVQSPDHVVIYNEMIHESRVVALNGRPHLDQNIRQYQGDSLGRWDGETLVVDTTNFSEKTNFRGSTSGLHMIERFTRLGPNLLKYQATFDDPTTWTRPWTAENVWRTSKGRIYEYECHEGNYGLTGILAGAREEERAAQASKQSPK